MTTNGTRTVKHARTSRIERIISWAEQIPVPYLAGLLSTVILATSATCLWRLHSAGLSRWCVLLSVPIAACSFGIMTATAGWRDYPGREPQRARTVMVMFALILLGVVRIFLPVSLDAGHKAIWISALMVAAGVAMLFLTMNLVAWLLDPHVLPRDHLRLERLLNRWAFVLVLGAFVLIVCAVAAFSLPGRTPVLPAQPRPTHSLVVLLAVVVIALLAVVVTYPGWGVTADATYITTLLCTGVVIGFFGLTRDLGVAVALFAASIAVLVSSTRGRCTVPAQAGTAKPPGWFTFVPYSSVIFASGAIVVIGFGSVVLRIQRFDPRDVLGYSDRQPAPFRTSNDFMSVIVGPGLGHRFAQRGHGTSGSAPDLLALIGREAGLSSLLGLAIVFGLLFVALARLAAHVGNLTGAAVAWGLIVFLIAQCLLAAETLIPVVPIGEGPPLLSGGWADYLADVIAVGIVIGLSRTAGQLTPATAPVQTYPQQSQAATPA